MNAFEILVIILSTALAIFLVISIIIGILLVKVTLQIRRVTMKAEKAADNMESITSNISKASSGAFLGKLIFSGLKKFSKKK